MESEYAPVVDWLLAAKEPWVVYNTLIDLAGAAPDGAEARAAYQALQRHPRVTALCAALETWPPRPMTRCYDPDSDLWKLTTLADFGLRRDDERIAAIAERVFIAQSSSGAFLHGGFDHTRAYHERPYICLAHVMTYALARFGYLGDLRLECAFAQAMAWQRPDGGWHPNRPNLPGEGDEEEPSCPFGTLNILRALAVRPRMADGPIARRAAEYLLICWQRRAVPYRPAGFGIGTTWAQVEYPFVQYQLLKTVDTLVQIPPVRGDQRLEQMLALLSGKRDDAGRWSAEGVDKNWSGYDFGQKRRPSPWLTFLAVRALVRAKAPAEEVEPAAI